MNIYLIGMYENPTADRLLDVETAEYAYFAAVGTWISKRPPCSVCGWHWQQYGQPLKVQWERSTSVIGDFSWDGPFGYLFTVRRPVAHSLHDMHFDCSFLPVGVVPTTKGSVDGLTPTLNESAKLLWGVCESLINLDRHASEVNKTHSCDVCGHVEYTFRKDGIVIREADWRGEKMFRISTNEDSLATFVAEEGRKLICAAGFSNIAFTLAGKIIR